MAPPSTLSKKWWVVFDCSKPIAALPRLSRVEPEADCCECADEADLFGAMCCSCSGQSFIASSFDLSFGGSCGGKGKAGAVNRMAATKAASTKVTFRICVPLVILWISEGLE